MFQENETKELFVNRLKSLQLVSTHAYKTSFQT